MREHREDARKAHEAARILRGVLRDAEPTEDETAALVRRLRDDE